MGRNVEESSQEFYNIYIYGDRETVVKHQPQNVVPKPKYE
jgi:hypothetical protein